MITGRWREDQLNLLKEKIIEAKKLRCETNKAPKVRTLSRMNPPIASKWLA
jgi:hypothetical protein